MSENNTRILGGLYRIDKKIGGGGMSEVFLGRNIRLNKNVAIKRVPKNLDETFDLLAEENILKKLDHPYIVRITDIIETRDYLYIVEDYIEGKTMQEVIDEQGTVSEDISLAWFKDLCDILIYLHSQHPPIIYRDMKPGNIMIQKNGKPKLIDFGISREYKKNNARDTSLYLSPGFAAPEQYGGAQTDARTDIYGLGMTMYYLVTGKAPTDLYEYLPPNQVNPNVSDGLTTIIDKCVERNPANRYQTAEDLRYDLDHIQDLDASWKSYIKKKHLLKALPFIMITAGIALVCGGFILNRNSSIDAYNLLIRKAQSESGEAALETIAQAKEMNPEYSAAYILEASVYYSEGEYQKVIDYVNGIEADGIVTIENNPEIYNLLGAAYFEVQDYDNAVNVFGQLAGSGNELEITNTLDYAAALARTGKTEQAEQVLESVKSSAEEPYYSYLKAELSYLQKDYQAAAQSYQEVIDTNQDADLTKKAVLALAETYRDSLSASDGQEIEDAATKEINLINTALSNVNLNFGSYIYELLGQAYYNRAAENNNNADDLHSSIDAFEKVINQGVKKAYIYSNIYKLDNLLGDYQSAGTILDEYETAFPNDFMVNVYRAENEINLQFTKANESERDFSKVLQEYEIAKSKVKSSDDTEELSSLESYIQQLRDEGWI